MSLMIKIAKSSIDNISSTGIAYEIKHRKTTKCLLLLSCTPCVLFSTFARLLSCPFQCVLNKNVSCNPFLACLTDSVLTFKSDECICTAVSAADKIVKTTEVLTLTEAEEIEILIYAAKRIQNTPLMKYRYAIADFVKPIILKQTLFVSSTPANVIITADEAVNSMKNINRRIYNLKKNDDNDNNDDNNDDSIESIESGDKSDNNVISINNRL